MQRIGLLYRGTRGALPASERADALLGPLFDALGELGAHTEHVVYADDALDEVRQQLLHLDGVLVWVNPIQDGANRALLDPLLREASEHGAWVSAHPDVIAKMGTKEVLYRTRSLGWGTESDLYASPGELATRFPQNLARSGQLVLKQARGNGGNGVWRVQLPSASTPVKANTPVRVQDALSRGVSFEDTTVGAFLERCNAYFVWSGSVISQAYQPRLPDGMIRCYFVQDRVVGFCHQWPGGLLDVPHVEPRPSRDPWEDADAEPYGRLRSLAEGEWVPGMQDLLGLDTASLPLIWDADFLYGPGDAAGNDTYVLCEINISCVWPYPPQAHRPIAAAALARTASASGGVTLRM